MKFMNCIIAIAVFTGVLGDYGSISEHCGKEIWGQHNLQLEGLIGGQQDKGQQEVGDLSHSQLLVHLVQYKFGFHIHRGVQHTQMVELSPTSVAMLKFSDLDNGARYVTIISTTKTQL